MMLSDLYIATRTLENPIRQRTRQSVDLPMIVNTVAEFYGHTKEQILSKDKHAPLVWSRHAAMSLTKELTALPLESIAHGFNKKHHGTIIYAVKKVSAECDLYAYRKQEYETLLKSLS